MVGRCISRSPYYHNTYAYPATNNRCLIRVQFSVGWEVVLKLVETANFGRGCHNRMSPHIEAHSTTTSAAGSSSTPEPSELQLCGQYPSLARSLTCPERSEQCPPLIARYFISGDGREMPFLSCSPSPLSEAQHPKRYFVHIGHER